MEINDLTLGQINQIQKMFNLEKGNTEYPIGKNVIIRTVTMIYTGKLKEVTESDFILTECSWIPETARYSSFVSNGDVNECEPYPDDLLVYVNRGAFVDFCELRAPLPRNQE